MFDRNPDYVPRDEPPDGLAGGRRVKVDRVEWRVIPDPSTAAGALQAGEVDVIEQPALELLPLLRRSAGVRLQKLTDLSNQTMLRPNSLYPPFNNPKARLALAYLIDQNDIMAAGFGDQDIGRRAVPTSSAADPTAPWPARRRSSPIWTAPEHC